MKVPRTRKPRRKTKRHSGRGPRISRLEHIIIHELLEPKLLLAGLTPVQVQTAYGLNHITYGGVAAQGQGQTIAIIDAGDDSKFVDNTAANFATSDLGVFDSTYKLSDPPSFTVIGEDGGARPMYSGSAENPVDAAETAGDVEWAHAIAPQANIILIEMVDFKSADIAAAVGTASAKGASVVSMSFIAGEYAGELSTDKENDSIFSGAGVTYVASTGDNGAPGGYAAFSPNVLAVGATNLQLNSDNTWKGETAWGDPTGNDLQIVDNTTTSGAFSQTGNWTNSSGAGYGGSYLIAATGSNSTAKWTFNNVPLYGAGQTDSDIYVSWVPSAGAATNATYTVSDGATPTPHTATFTIDQTKAPSGLVAYPLLQNVLSDFYSTTGTITITLNASGANGSVSADAVMVRTHNSGGSGGGISMYEAQPAYQTGVVTQSSTKRTIPDVSMIGDPASSVAIIDTLSGSTTFAGTSLSAPCWAGIMAIIDQGLTVSAGTQTSYSSSSPSDGIQAKLYKLPATDFHDITSGSNGYSAAKGYDLVTGLGTPVADLLIPDLAGTSINYTVPTAGSPHELVLRKKGTNVELLDNGTAVESLPCGTISDVNITDPNTSNDSLTVDNNFDGSFSAHVRFNHTGSSGLDTVEINEPNGPSNNVTVSESQSAAGAGNITNDGASQAIDFQGVSEVDVNAGSGGLQKLHVNGGAGNDTLTIDSTSGLFATAAGATNGIFFNGGDGRNQLVLQQTTATPQTSDVYSVGPNNGEGTDVITGPTGTQTVEFQNLAPVLDTVPATTATVNATSAANAINYTQGNVVANGLVTIDDQESYEFSNKIDLILNGLAGSDTINIDNQAASPPAGLVNIFVNGGDPTGPGSLGDALIVNGTAATAAVNIAPTAADGGTVAVNGQPGVSFGGIESLVYNGQAAYAAVMVTTPLLAQRIVYTAGAAANSATVDVGALVPVALVKLGGSASVALAKTGGGAGDTLVYNGTSGNDRFTVSDSAVSISINNQATLIGPGVTNLVLNGGLGAANVLSIQAPAANDFVGIEKGNAPDSGTVYMLSGAVPRRTVSYNNVAYVNPVVAGDAKLLVSGPDSNEPNSTLGTATFLGSGATLQISHAAIFPDNVLVPPLSADNDYYRVVAQQTGTLDFQVYFKLYSATLLPGGGNLALEVLDSTGHVVAHTAAPALFGAVGSTSDARIRIPAVAGQSYYLHVFGANTDGTPNTTVLNGYNATIINTPAPVPTTLELSRNEGTGDLPSNAPNSDTGRSQFDNVTDNNKPTIFIRLSDGALLNDLPGNGASGSPPAGVIPIPFSPNAATPGFRVAIFDGNDTQNPVSVGFAVPVPPVGPITFPGLYELTLTTALADGVHHLTAEVQMVDPASTPQTGFGGASASLDVTIDTQPPPIAFGTGVAGSNTGLSAASDTGIIGQPATLSDRVTSDSKPTFYGVAEADAIVRLYVQTPSGNVFIGQTTATPSDGTNADASGQWTITSNLDLNATSLGLPLDGARNLLVTAEDLAGNVSPTQPLTIFLDTQGPKVNNINISSAATFPLFNTTVTPTPAATPTPLISTLDVTFGDQPVRVGPDFVYPAVNQVLATTTANYALVGENNGVIPITLVTFSDNTTSGTPGTTTLTLHFPAKDTPLPDDRYTLTISDRITDKAGNALQGSFDGKSFPTGLASGNGSQSQTFVGAFTVNSRAHLGNYSSGTVNLDINGNGSFDPQNSDANNRDTIITMGYPSDRVFSGNFSTSYGGTPVADTANGFEKLAAYGPDANGNFRWLYNLSGAGGTATSVAQPNAIDGLPVAGNFAGSSLVAGSNPPVTTLGDQVGLFDGKAWYLDVLDQGYISPADMAAPASATHAAGYLPSNMAGLPFVGNFDGYTDLGTYQNGVLEFDLASLDPNHILTGQWNVQVNVNDLFSSIPFNYVTARPVAGYFNGLGQESSIGFYAPDGTTSNAGTADWYILEPTSSTLTGAPSTPAASLFSSGMVTAFTPAQQAALEAGSYFFNVIHAFKDQTLGGNDVFYQFGNQFSLPVAGVWDPPAEVGGLTSGATPTPSAQGNYVAELYTQILARPASATDVAFWVNQLQSGTTPAQLAQLLVTSNEYRANQINQLYEQYLGRPAEAAGIAYWSAVWNATGGPEQVQAGIISSPEYFATAQQQHPSLPAGAAWVTALYQNLLGRGASTAEVNYWQNGLQATSPQSVVLGFVTSDEYHWGLVGRDFQLYLGRPADPASAQALVEQLRGNLTQDQLLTLILSSGEYIARSS